MMNIYIYIYILCITICVCIHIYAYAAKQLLQILYIIILYCLVEPYTVKTIHVINVYNNIMLVTVENL